MFDVNLNDKLNHVKLTIFRQTLFVFEIKLYYKYSYCRPSKLTNDYEIYSLVNISEEISNAFGDNFKILWDGKNVSTPSNTLKNNKY